MPRPHHIPKDAYRDNLYFAMCLLWSWLSFDSSSNLSTPTGDGVLLQGLGSVVVLLPLVFLVDVTSTILVGDRHIMYALTLIRIRIVAINFPWGRLYRLLLCHYLRMRPVTLPFLLPNSDSADLESNNLLMVVEVMRSASTACRQRPLLARPDMASSERKCCNWSHHYVGRAVQR
ncbi:hypothetical protein BHM03_00044849 [Ensete ventricosum]|nr:hypothetical protein BHM03_00044849 [Ensete ventricosum]